MTSPKDPASAGGSKEAFRFIGQPNSEVSRNAIYTLDQPSPAIIRFVLATLPFTPRWSATFEKPELIDGINTNTSIVYHGSVGQLKSRRRNPTRGRYEETTPEQEIDWALKDPAPDRLLIEDSVFPNTCSYREFQQYWFPEIMSAGYGVASLRLVDYFDTRNVSLDHPTGKIISGVVVDDHQLRVYTHHDPINETRAGLTLPGEGRIPSIISGDTMHSWFTLVQRMQKSLQ